MGDVVLIPTEIALREKEVESLCALIEEDLPVSHKITGLARGALESMAGGGFMIRPEEIGQIQQSTGETVSGFDDLLPLIEAGAGRSGGKMRLYWDVDPAYQETIRQKAEFQGCTELEISQRCIDEAIDNGILLGDITPSPERILMSPDAKTELVELLGADFSNGSELAELIKQSLGASTPFAEESETALIE